MSSALLYRAIWYSLICKGFFFSLSFFFFVIDLRAIDQSMHDSGPFSFFSHTRSEGLSLFFPSSSPPPPPAGSMIRYNRQAITVGPKYDESTGAGFIQGTVYNIMRSGLQTPQPLVIMLFYSLDELPL